MKDEAYLINLDDYKSIVTHWIALYVVAHWIALYVVDNNVSYSDSYRVEHIPKEI